MLSSWVATVKENTWIQYTSIQFATYAVFLAKVSKFMSASHGKRLSDWNSAAIVASDFVASHSCNILPLTVF